MLSCCPSTLIPHPCACPASCACPECLACPMFCASGFIWSVFFVTSIIFSITCPGATSGSERFLDRSQGCTWSTIARGMAFIGQFVVSSMTCASCFVFFVFCVTSILVLITRGPERFPGRSQRWLTIARGMAFIVQFGVSSMPCASGFVLSMFCVTSLR